MSSSSAGSVLMTLGIGLVVVGLLVSLGGFGWFGRLPGDIRIERDAVLAPQHACVLAVHDPTNVLD